MASRWVVGARVCGVMAALGCAESPPPAPETAGVVLPEWTEAPRRNTGRSKDVTTIEQQEGLVYGDPSESNRRARPRKKAATSDNFSKRSNSRFYGGCGALNGAKCP